MNVHYILRLISEIGSALCARANVKLYNLIDTNETFNAAHTYRYRHIDIQTYTNTYVLQTRTQKLLKPEKSKRNKQSLNELNEHTAHQNIRQQPTK